MPIYFRPYIDFSTQVPNASEILPSSSDASGTARSYLAMNFSCFCFGSRRARAHPLQQPAEEAQGGVVAWVDQCMRGEMPDRMRQPRIETRAVNQLNRVRRKFEGDGAARSKLYVERSRRRLMARHVLTRLR